MIDRPLRIAVVGSGPAALYGIGQLLDAADADAEIDVFERLPVPWGLVRGAVAPDHPEKKAVIDRQFAHFLRDRRVRFLGNVEIGRDVSAAELSDWYDAVLYATGADGDVAMDIPGETLSGSWASRDFVGFYSGHADFSHLRFDLGCSRAVIVGNGNVALDLARMLTLPLAELERTDIADHALEALRGSAIREVVILARRGAAQAAFNNPELEELEHLPDVGIEVLDRGTIAAADLAGVDGVVQRKLQTLRRLHARAGRPGDRRITFSFLVSPVEIRGAGHVERLIATRNALRPTAAGFEAVPTSETIEIETGLVLRAVGYRGTPLPGLPFDPVKGVIANLDGRVADGGRVLPGMYVAGWAKRGCRGIIGTNRKCAADTLRHFFEDRRAGRLRPGSLDRQGVVDLLRARGLMIMTHAGWTAIDRAERRAGRRCDRPRVKLTDRAAMLECAGLVSARA
ncbi:FAD-dependent oxidoreductase [Rhizorhabdus dicambivorans]|uniref:NADP oxidoreductase n=1 Tax=Rhizorhabdus dicambivorans TaxID=1850238 RepID=A0A2A4FRC5_9SPHN|nr:FAD-dependent oxidoreductase [Rhizorhabdus dicambivorans]ATE63835.1 NADP oxidoreductase [Rhizorhabdus dicambivorans]PCE40669.1 NADP oxidoreductase [Rhizorhabdus dicambivorans]